MQSISDDDLYRRLCFDNPWWAVSAETEVRFRHPPRRAFFPAFFERVTEAPGDRPLLLAGPLRAGKTVMLRQAVARLIEQGVPPTSVLYCSLATPSTAGAPLQRLVEVFRTRHGHGPEDRVYLFLDELPYAHNWAQGIDDLAWAHPGTRVVGALSAAAPALVTGDSGTGKGPQVFVLPPLTFSEFLRFRGTEETLFGPAADVGVGSTVVRPAVVRTLNDEFHRYVNFAGFLEGVLGKARGSPAPAFIRGGLAERVLHRDLASLAGINDSGELNRLFAILALNTAREVTMEELAKEAGIAKNTLRKYLDYLESAFLVRRLPRVDRRARRFQRAVAFKVHLTAPCLYAALFGPVGPGDEAFPWLAETALVAQWLGSPAMADLAYASWRGGTVDLLALDPETGHPDHAYEIDWADATPGAEKGPRRLARFVEGTNRAARAYVLTRSVARPASVGGLEITLA
ncbi:MAG: ATP-binding protein, partial [Rhodospirillales bacterium]